MQGLLEIMLILASLDVTPESTGPQPAGSWITLWTEIGNSKPAISRCASRATGKGPSRRLIALFWLRLGST